MKIQLVSITLTRIRTSQNISRASQQNNATAYSSSTEVDGDLF